MKYVKYLYKYIYKGHDQEIIIMQFTEFKKTKSWLDSCYIYAYKCCWKLFHMHLHHDYPNVICLVAHF